MRKLILLVCMVMCFGLVGSAQSTPQVSLAWDWEGDPTDLGGFKVHYGSSTGQYTQQVDAGKNYTVSVPVDDKPTFFAATAYDKYGRESSFSNEVAIPSGPKPPVLKVVVKVEVSPQ